MRAEEMVGKHSHICCPDVYIIVCEQNLGSLYSDGALKLTSGFIIQPS